MGKRKKKKIADAIEVFNDLANDGDPIVSLPKEKKLYNPIMAVPIERIQNHQQKLKVFKEENATFDVPDWWKAIHVEHFFHKAQSTFSMRPIRGTFDPLEKVVLKTLYICRIRDWNLHDRDHLKALAYCVQKHNGKLYDVGQLMMIEMHRNTGRGITDYEMRFLDFGAEKKMCSATETLIYRKGYGINIWPKWDDNLIPPCLFLGYQKTFKVVAKMVDGKQIKLH